MKTPRLAKGIIWALKDFGKMNIKELTDAIGWEKSQVVNEIRRLKDKTILGLFMTETTTKHGKAYELDPVMRNGGTVDFLYALAKKTFDFEKTIQERI
jgi:predicted transcriptional regulator